MTPPEEPTRPASGRISAVGIAALAVLAALIGLEPRWNARFQSAWFDTYQILVPRTPASTPVTVVEIDEKSLARLGQWPWPRTVLAELLRRIEHEQPAAIAVDILMPEPDRLSPERLLAGAGRDDPVLARRLAALPWGDRELAAAIREGPVVLGFAATPERTEHEPDAPPFLVVDRRAHAVPPAALAAIPRHGGALTNIAELDRAAAGHGLISAGRSDDVIRRVPLVARIGDRLVPSLSLEMLRVALHAPDVRLFVDGTSLGTVAVGDFVVPTESDGELRIYYSRRDLHRSVSAVDVLDGRVDPAQLQRKLIVIGTTGLASVDYQNTPLGQRMPGSEIHAQVLENLYEQSWLARPSWAPAAELAAFVLLGLALIWATPRWKPSHAALLALGAIALPLAAGAAAFAAKRLVFDAAAPALGLLVLFSLLLTLTLADATQRRKRAERQVQVQREQAAYIEGELGAAKRIQSGFLPRADLLRDDRRVEVAAAMIPARDVAGDLYDYFLLDERRLFFLIGDVSGKGLSASLFMAVSKALYKSSALRSPRATIGELMRSANDEVSRDNPELLFVAAFAGVLDLKSGELAYCNAGHENPYLLHPTAPRLRRLVDGAGPPLCTVDDFAYDGGTLRLRPGELLCLFTDGVVEAENQAGERYGSRRLEATLDSRLDGAPTARALVDALCADVQAFAKGAAPADDVTVLAIRWTGARPAP